MIQLTAKRVIMRVSALFTYVHDYLSHVKFSVYYHSNKTLSKDMCRCNIMLLNHQLEKAQTYTNQKQNYGKQKVQSLLFKIEQYVRLFGFDDLMLQSLGVINSHLSCEMAYKDNQIEKKFDSILANQGIPKETLSNIAGSLSSIPKDIIHLDALYPFLVSRHSCRQFSKESVSTDDIVLAVKYAMTAPSACNRQPIRAHYYNDPNTIECIIRAQKADIDWCLGAKGLFIITANRNYIRDYIERNQLMFDAGLFSMNLVLGLHNLNIGSCFKMAQKKNAIDKCTKMIGGIPDEEDVCVLLLVGKYPTEGFVFAKSNRLNLSKILINHQFES